MTPTGVREEESDAQTSQTSATYHGDSDAYRQDHHRAPVGARASPHTPVLTGVGGLVRSSLRAEAAASPPPKRSTRHDQRVQPGTIVMRRFCLPLFSIFTTDM